MILYSKNASTGSSSDVILDLPKGTVVLGNDKPLLESGVRREAGLGVSILDELEKAHWERIEHQTPEVAEIMCKVQMLDDLPVRFHFLQHRLFTWPKECVPRLYLTVKSRCHTNFATTCVKAGHSCCRKIVSYCGLFGKTLFKSAHRGIQKVVGFVGTWAVWDIGIAGKSTFR